VFVDNYHKQLRQAMGIPPLRIQNGGDSNDPMSYQDGIFHKKKKKRQRSNKRKDSMISHSSSPKGARRSDEEFDKVVYDSRRSHKMSLKTPDR
jgi:hypothetical protein